MVQTRFNPTKGVHGAHEAVNRDRDLVLRLRASLRSADMDEITQSMKVSVVEEKSGRVIVEGSTEENDERSVHLDSLELSSSQSYLLKYQFFEKNAGLTSFEEKTISAAHMGASACSKPFVVQELVIASKDLIRDRATQYKQKGANNGGIPQDHKPEYDITSLKKHCNFELMNNTKEDLKHGEDGVYCQRMAYRYSISSHASQELNQVFKQTFEVVGAAHESVTYLFDLTLGFEFSTSAQMKAILRRIDYEADEHEFDYNPLACLYDHACYETELIGKNEINLFVILTPGDYQLIIFDQQDNNMRSWITNDLGLHELPFTLELQSTPIVQNEERTMCGNKLFMTEEFIQHRFIDGRGGQRFTFDDHIIFALVNSTQRIEIVPEEDMLLKLFSKEAYGINMAMTICSHQDCYTTSSQVGNTEILQAIVKKDHTYYIYLDYSNSIISLSSFFDCPHAHLHLSMIKVSEAEQILHEQSTKTSEWLDTKKRDSERSLTALVDKLSRSTANLGDGVSVSSDENTIYTYQFGKSENKASSKVLTKRDFSVQGHTSKQVVFEVFYDPQFYDIELMVSSQDASEVHQSYYRKQTPDLTHYKGAKRVFAEMEPGDYTLQIIAKTPGERHIPSTLVPRFIEFQLFVVEAEIIPTQSLYTPSLNYFGLFGPKGIGFGQLVYHKDDLVLNSREYMDIFFKLSGDGASHHEGPSIDVQVIEIDGEGEQLDITLIEVPKNASKDPERHPKSSRYQDEFEEGFEYESLVSSDLHSNTQYRVRILNRDSSVKARMGIKISVTEKAESDFEGHEHEVLPASFSEVVRVKPKIPGMKEASFIQGSKMVMETFKVASLQPYVPKSSKVYQALFKTGPNSDDSFVPSLPFEIHEPSAQLYVQVMEYSGREDLFVTVYSYSDNEEVARSVLGKYANSLGPVTLTKGKYRLVVHPDQDSQSLETSSSLIRFGLDILLEQQDIGGGDFETIVEEIELCPLQQIPDNFNGPGMIHALAGNSMQSLNRYKLTEVLEGTSVKFSLTEPSLVMFYIDLPEGLKGEAELVRVSGTYTTKVSTEDINKGDETFLRQKGGFQHRQIIQFREFLDQGNYNIKIEAWEASGTGNRKMPRCEGYHMSLQVHPLYQEQLQSYIGAECDRTQFIPEHLTFDEIKEGKLSYPVSENTVDVAYLDLKQSGSGPFLFFFEIQYDPTDVGIVGLSLSQYDADASLFHQSALYRSPQDGVTQIFTIVESGTYAVGIQTLTSTHNMFVTHGIGHNAGQAFGQNLLHQPCAGMRYTYLVASTRKGDLRAMQANPFSMLSLLLGGGLSKIAKQKQLDSELLDEMGDSSMFGSCPHDDLPYDLPVSESGFDRYYNLLIQEKPADNLDLVVMQESLLRISIKTNSVKNQVRVFIYSDAYTNTPITWTTGSRQASTLLHMLKPQQNAYRLRVEYESLDQDDACPLFSMRVISKPVALALREDIGCKGEQLPPQAININKEDFIHSQWYAFPSDYTDRVTGGQGGMEYDIVLKWPDADPKAEYYLDVETRSDFLANQMSFSLLYEDKFKVLRPLGRSMTVKSSVENGDLVQRLKLLDREGELADDIDLSGAILRLKIPNSVISLPHTLHSSHQMPDKSEICHNFKLSVRAEKVSGKNGKGSIEQSQTRLMRVRWDGQRVQEGIYDPRQKIIASLEFDRSMSQAFQVLKSLDWAILTPLKKEDAGTTRDSPGVALPSYKSLSQYDPSTVVLQFPPGALARGWCYHLTMNQFPSPMGGPPAFDEGLLGSDLTVCGSNCHCNWAGTSSCSETTSECLCRFPHTGPDCGQCEAGHTKDQESGECVPSKKCKELGGNEDCSGKGSCEQRGDSAVCHCDPGFANDGLKQCSRCADPLFKFPDCQVRNWVIDEPDVNCKELEYRMPRTMYLAEGGTKHDQPFQSEEGVLNWAKRYRLSDGTSIRKSSTHWFLVPTNSVMRIFVDNVQSGVLIKYRVMDHDYREILTSEAHTSDADADGYLEMGNDIILLHEPERDPANSPFTILFEYKLQEDDEDWDAPHKECPMIDLRVIVEPLITAESSLKCTDEEKQLSMKSRPTGWQFGSSSRFEQEKVVLKSDDENLFEHDGEKNVNFAILRYDITVESSGHALSIVATYPFSSLVPSLTLYDKSTDEDIELERTSSLEGVEHRQMEITRDQDMATYIEVPSLDKGNYQLQIEIPRSTFLPTNQFETCISFDLVVEYVVKQNNQIEFTPLSVFPLSLQNLKSKDEKVIEVELDHPFSLDDLISKPSDRFYICELVNLGNSQHRISPRHVQVEGTQTLRLDFDFAKATLHTQGDQCYKLQCSTMSALKKEKLGQIQATTKYCFETTDQLSHDKLGKCNPFAQPKLSQDESCVCSSPYTGKYCEQCEEGFRSVKRALGQGKDAVDHNICVMDHDHLSSAVCNSHGKPQHSEATSLEQVECHCDAGFGGSYCDYCVDPSFAYPDCDKSISSLIYDPEATHSFLSRRRYNEHGYSTVAAQYFKESELEPSLFNEECAWVDFPDDFDRVEFGREFSDGSFHIADLYVVNHKQDNIAKIRAPGPGTFKILIQQPEVEEELAGETDTAFDIEIGIYDPLKKKFIKSSMNRHLLLSGGRPAKLEYAHLTLDIDHGYAERPLFVFFRALNFSDESHQQQDGCLSLYMEVEFNPHKEECMHSPVLQNSRDVEVLKDESHSAAIAQTGNAKPLKGSEHSVTDSSATFIAFRDYYVDEQKSSDSNERDADQEVTISLQQKFIEANTLDLLVEVIAEDIDLQEAHKLAKNPPLHNDNPTHGIMHHTNQDGRVELVRGGKGPACKDSCLVGGEKSFNEMQRSLALSPRTYFRVWIFQQTPEHQQRNSKWCSNYELFVNMRPLITGSREQQKKQADMLKCPVPDLPETLNSPHFLTGADGKQKDFHYRQRYRIDHLWHNKAHQISFKLDEPSLFRVLAPVHKHLDFELVLNQEKGAYHHKTMVRAKKEDFHSTIFAQLEAGEYHLKFTFMTDAALLQLPCQTVHLEMAIATIERSKERIALFKEIGPQNSKTELNLEDMFKQSGKEPLKMFKPAAIGWRHVEPGVPPYIDQSELFKVLMKEGFQIAEDDEAGIVVEVKAPFLLSDINFALTNVRTGQTVEDEGSETQGKLVVGKLQPGSYELVVYTHECVTNIDPHADQDAIHSFDALIYMNVHLLRVADQHSASARPPSVQLDVLDYKEENTDMARHVRSEVVGTDEVTPLQVTKRELTCLREYNQLPASLEKISELGQFDLTDHYYVPTASFHSHHIRFIASSKQNAIQIFLGKANSKIVVYEAETRTPVAQSKGVDSGKAQLLVATGLNSGTAYSILLEFSESTIELDGEAAEDCEHFIMVVKTWDSSQMCEEGDTHSEDSFHVNPSDDPKSSSFLTLNGKSATKELVISGKEAVNLNIQVDSTSSIFRAEMSLKPSHDDEEHEEDHEEASVKDLKKKIAPSAIDFSIKGTTIYGFHHLQPGTYKMKFRQPFKESHCATSVSISLNAWISHPAGSKASFSGLNLYQSQQEEEERPRLSTKLPIDLNSFKFKGGPNKKEDHLLFSGPVQLDKIENQNIIHFSVEQDNTEIHFYGEHSGLAMTLYNSTSDHAKALGAASGGSLTKKLVKGAYKVKLSLASQEEKQAALASAPRVWLTISIAPPEQLNQYNSTWHESNEECDSGSNFPLALRQQKQQDVHQLFYSYPLVKVSPQAMKQSVLQTYNFRVNVTSRLYFEVGMHLLSSHATLQLSALNDKQFTVQGKQRENLNVLDTQVGPGDYSVAVKSVIHSYDRRQTGLDQCAVFSLQGLVEPISLMSAHANSGEIVQRGFSNCPAAADGDTLPTKIYGSEAQTRGGGELHIDSTGHFIRRFRNVLMKLSREYSESVPETDRVEIEVIEDARLHLSFLYESFGPNEIQVKVTDTAMLSREIKPASKYEVMDIEDNRVELVNEYQLSKGHHYTIAVSYVGTTELDEEGNEKCSVYDITLSVSHTADLIQETRCFDDQSTPSFVSGLPHSIGDRDLDNDGIYKFDKLLRLHYPNDYKDVSKSEKGAYSTGSGANSLDELVFIKLSQNYDIIVETEFQFDQGLFTISLDELVTDQDGELTAVQSNLQAPLEFKQNNDHYRAMKRWLIAYDVESHGEDTEHALMISNRQPDILHQIHPGVHSEGCMYVSVKIQIRSSKRSTDQLYQASRDDSSVNPLIVSCRPDESPAFLHGRPEHVSFAVIFNKKPTLKHLGSTSPELTESELLQAFRLKVTTVNLQDGVRQDEVIGPVQVYSSNKEYREDEFYLTVDYDVSEFVNSASEKISHAQLIVLNERLVDADGHEFTLDKALKERGLPIYVFEQADVEQMMKEETNEIKAAMEGSEIERESERQQGEDVMTERSDLDSKIEHVRQETQPQDQHHEAVRCMCAHGDCNDGESQCNGRCHSGWSGPNCDTPESDDLTKTVNTHQKQDYTGDGLYRPQTISDARVTGPVKEGKAEASIEPAHKIDYTGKKAKKIEDEGHTQHSSYQDQVSSHSEELVQTTKTNTPALEPAEEEQKGPTLPMILGGIVVIYCMLTNLKCPSRSQAPGPRYRPVGGQEGMPGAGDSDDDNDDDNDDMSARRRMLELSALGSKNKPKNEQKQGTEERKESFPPTSFDRKPEPQSKPTEEDDPAAEIQKELELFAQDEEDESNALISTEQPQAEEWTDFHGQPRQAQDEAELQEYEKYFDENR